MKKRYYLTTVPRPIERQQGQVVLTIGPHVFTKQDLVNIGCGNWRAARILQGLVKRKKIMTIAGLFHLNPYDDVLTANGGVSAYMTMWVAICILGDHGYNVDGWLEKIRRERKRRRVA